jgi:hypothetical protein
MMQHTWMSEVLPVLQFGITTMRFGHEMATLPAHKSERGRRERFFDEMIFMKGLSLYGGGGFGIKLDSFLAIQLTKFYPNFLEFKIISSPEKHHPLANTSFLEFFSFQDSNIAKFLKHPLNDK